MACLWNPNSYRLEHKYGRNPWKMSKIGQNSMKKWLFFAITLPWMARYGSKTSFLLIFSARDDLVKVSWKSDARKCQNQLTPPYFDQLSERSPPLSRLSSLWWWWFDTLQSQRSRLPRRERNRSLRLSGCWWSVCGGGRIKIPRQSKRRILWEIFTSRTTVVSMLLSKTNDSSWNSKIKML